MPFRLVLFRVPDVGERYIRAGGRTDSRTMQLHRLTTEASSVEDERQELARLRVCRAECFTAARRRIREARAMIRQTKSWAEEVRLERCVVDIKRDLRLAAFPRVCLSIASVKEALRAKRAAAAAQAAQAARESARRRAAEKLLRMWQIEPLLADAILRLALSDEED